MIQIPERVEFLKKIHLFFSVKEEVLMSIANSLEEDQYSIDTDISALVSSGTALFIVFSGSLRLEGKAGQKPQTLTNGDYIGAEQVLARRALAGAVLAGPGTRLLVLPAEVLKTIFKQFPRIKYSLEVDVQSRRLARVLRFDWLSENEFIYFLARKHYLNLIEALIGPLVGLLLSSFLLIWGVSTQASFPAYAGGILIWPVLGWAAWQALDWSNDYYIVTNRRVVWLEKVIGLYDSRQEAPLTTLLSVGVETDLIGRMLDYGTVVVRTFVGHIQFQRVIHPYEASHLIAEHWNRTKQVSSSTEKMAMNDILREKMGLPTPVKPQEAPLPTQTVLSSHSAAFTIGKALGGNLFKIRFEDSGTITYRKHWVVLLRQTWKPAFFFLVVLAWMGYHLAALLRAGAIIQHTLDGRTLPDTLLLSMVLILFLLSLWWIYQFWDWSNDIFQVTPDQILDIDKKPFGTEERRAAQLENILSTQYSRLGLMGYLFNFGTVYITVGGSQLAFEDVQDPASVQADIDRRREVREAERKESQARQERERMADWFAAYRENLEALDPEHQPSEGGKKNG